jgi:Cof subfamily protein (haloacid dehalogenase superfamily)
MRLHCMLFSFMNFKVVCTDIDGTLLDSRRELSDKTISTFRRLPQDVIVILASSRMPSAMRHLQDQLGVLHYPIICYNGGYLIHYTNENSEPEILDSVIMPLSVCKGIIDLTQATTIHTSLYFKDEWYAPSWDYWTEREARVTKTDPIISNGADVIERWKQNHQGAHKVMCMGPESEIQVMEQKLRVHYSNDIHIYRSRPTYLELAPKSISKGSSLELLLKKRYSFSLNDVIAFGDNYNDIELLQVAGHGVAVSNARAEVKAVANEVTVDSKADGVAIVLEKYFKTQPV